MRNDSLLIVGAGEQAGAPVLGAFPTSQKVTFVLRT